MAVARGVAFAEGAGVGTGDAVAGAGPAEGVEPPPLHAASRHDDKETATTKARWCIESANPQPLITATRKQIVNVPLAADFAVPKVGLLLLGGCAVTIDGCDAGAPPNVKSRSLLAYLALRRNESIRRETLMAEFWPDAEGRNARNSLKTALATVRRFFRDYEIDPDTVVVADRDDVRWLCPVAIDVADVERCALGSEPGRKRAIASYGAEFLPGDYHAWAVDMRSRLAVRIEDILRAELAARPNEDVAERLLRLDPYCDEAFVALIDGALAAGNRREARSYFERYTGALSEIGVAPSADLGARVAAGSRSADADDPSAADRRFNEQLRAAGEDALDVAELLALEAELDDDDLVALLDWSLERVVEATSRLAVFRILEARFPARFSLEAYAQIAANRSTSGRRRLIISRIARRLALHEEPQSKSHLAEHYVTLGRSRDAAAASLEAGNGFLAFAAWTNALGAFDAGIEHLEPIATSVPATALLCKLHLGRGEAFFQLGEFLPAIRAIGSALDLTDPDGDAPMRARAFVRVGHAFARLNNADSAWMAVHQGELASLRAGALAELEVAELASRLLCNAMRFDEAIARAASAYERAIAAGAHRQASTLAHRVAEPLRRLLRFDECAKWTELQLAAAVVAGPEIEAQARYAAGAVAYARNQLERSETNSREALRILERMRRGPGAGNLPLGLAKWQCHQALAHVLFRRGHLDEALVECAWLVRSPWVFNTTSCSAITFATVVDVWLASGTQEHRAAALALADRIPALAPTDQSYFLDVLTRARLAAIEGSRARALHLLHAAHAATIAAERQMPDQIHISYEKLASAARGIDDVLAARSSEAARRHRESVKIAAGIAWSAATS